MSGFAALVQREAIRFVRQPGRVIATIGTPAVFLAILGGGLAGSTTGLEGVTGVDDARAYGAFLLPGLMALSVMFAGVFAGLDLISDRSQGLLAAVLAGPISMPAVIGARMVGAGVPALIQSVVLVVFAPLLGITLDPGGVLLSVVALCVLSVFVTGVCLAIAWRTASSASFHGVMNTVLMPGWLLGGSFFPVGGAAGWLEPVVLANPMTWCISTVRVSLTGAEADPGPLWLAWLISCGVAAGGAAAVGWAFRRRP